MDLCSLSDKVLLAVLICNEINIPDLVNLMLTCKRFSLPIRNCNKLWKLKFQLRWPRLHSYSEKVSVLWYQQVLTGMRTATKVSTTVRNMSSICYPICQVPMSESHSLVVQDSLISGIVLNELHDLSTTNENASKTTIYYAKDLMIKVRAGLIERQFKNYLARSDSQKSLIEGTAFISQWFNLENPLSCHFSFRRVMDFIEDTTKRVKTLAAAKHSNTMLNANAASNQDMKKYFMSCTYDVLFHELGFQVLPIEEMCLDDYLSISKILVKKKGCPIIMSILYREILDKLDVPFSLVICGDPQQYGKRNILLRLREIPEEIHDDQTFYINICESGDLKTSDSYEAAKSQPDASTNDLFHQMMKEVLEKAKTSPTFDNFTLDLQNDLRLLYRLAILLDPRNVSCAMRYATQCLKLGLQLDDAIVQLQCAGLRGYELVLKCFHKQRLQEQEIVVAKSARLRDPSVKFAVGQLMIYQPFSDNPYKGTCVITHWSVDFEKSDQWETVRRPDSDRKSPWYRIVMKFVPRAAHDLFGFQVQQESLEIHPNPKEAYLALGDAFKTFGFFTHFYGSRFLPNEQLQQHFPEDEAAALSLVAN